MNAIRRADALVADRLRRAAARERLPGPARGEAAADVAASVSAGSPHADRFAAEIAQAVAGTALAITAAQAHPPDLWAAARAAHPDPTVWFEQAVVLGHPTHPLARSRGTLTEGQTRSWAPEHRPRIDLGLHRVPGLRTEPDWPARDHEGPLLPVHPYQAERLGMTDTTPTWEAAPLMSLRTVSTGRRHVKCAVDLQLTSAVRHVSAAAVHNGPILSERLADPAGRCGIVLLPETAAIAHGPDGPRPDLAAIIRPAPHTMATGRPVPLGALAEPCPATGRPIAAAIAGADLNRWWTALVEAVLAPVRLYATCGVALEAHGQNTLVAFDTAARAAGLVYRDLGGIRVPAADWPGLEGTLGCEDEDERVRKLTAALFPTTLTALVDALAAWTGTDPGRWWRTVAAAAKDAAAPSPTLTAALFAPTWPIKATTAMRLADDPLTDLWARIDNPLADA